MDEPHADGVEQQRETFIQAGTLLRDGGESSLSNDLTIDIILIIETKCMTLVAERSKLKAAPPLGKLYEQASGRLWLHRLGEGGPAAVFLSGAGTVGLDYFNVQQRAAQLTASVLYDRGGTGWSDA